MNVKASLNSVFFLQDSQYNLVGVDNTFKLCTMKGIIKKFPLEIYLCRF